MTYSIPNWDSFENNRTRQLERMAWVPIPNKHDSEGFLTVVSQPNGMALYAAWILIVQLASKCPTRGVLVRNNGQPHDAESMALVTRCDVEVFRAAIPLLQSVGWLTEHRQVSDVDVTPTCRVTDKPLTTRARNGIELNGIELKTTLSAADAESPGKKKQCNGQTPESPIVKKTKSSSTPITSPTVNGSRPASNSGDDTCEITEGSNQKNAPADAKPVANARVVTNHPVVIVGSKTPSKDLDNASAANAGQNQSSKLTHERPFEIAWKLWNPAFRRSKGDADYAFDRALKKIISNEPLAGDTPAYFLISKIREYAKSPQGQGKYCPGMAPWLNQERWNDDPANWQNAYENFGSQPAPPVQKSRVMLEYDPDEMNRRKMEHSFPGEFGINAGAFNETHDVPSGSNGSQIHGTDG